MNGEGFLFLKNQQHQGTLHSLVIINPTRVGLLNFMHREEEGGGIKYLDQFMDL